MVSSSELRMPYRIQAFRPHEPASLRLKMPDQIYRYVAGNMRAASRLIMRLRFEVEVSLMQSQWHQIRWNTEYHFQNSGKSPIPSSFAYGICLRQLPTANWLRWCLHRQTTAGASQVWERGCHCFGRIVPPWNE
jgi:hypothetical protein